MTDADLIKQLDKMTDNDTKRIQNGNNIIDFIIRHSVGDWLYLESHMLKSMNPTCAGIYYDTRNWVLRTLHPAWRLVRNLYATLRPCNDYILSTIRLNTSTVCNANCIFCSYSQNGMIKTVMPMDTFYASIPFLLESGVDTIDISPTNGEALTDPNIKEKCRILKENGFKIWLSTNAILLEQHVDWLTGPYGIDQIHLSIPQPDAESYRRIYRVNHWPQVLDGITAFVNLNNERRQIKTLIAIRNHERPSSTVLAQDFRRLAALRNEHTVIAFTSVWDTWGGLIDQNQWTPYMIAGVRYWEPILRPCQISIQ